jgi:hypothetical protein
MQAYNHIGDERCEVLPIGWRWPADVRPTSAKVRDFATRMKSGEIFPACNAVLGRNGRFAVIDGVHRLAASLLAEFLWLPVIIVAETPYSPSLRNGCWV